MILALQFKFSWTKLNEKFRVPPSCILNRGAYPLGVHFSNTYKIPVIFQHADMVACLLIRYDYHVTPSAHTNDYHVGSQMSEIIAWSPTSASQGSRVGIFNFGVFVQLYQQNICLTLTDCFEIETDIQQKQKQTSVFGK